MATVDRVGHSPARTDRRLYALAVLLVASGLVHLVVWLVLGGPWTGRAAAFRPPASSG